MKILEKIALVIYSFIILVLATVLSLIIVGLVDVDIVPEIIESAMMEDVASKVILGINIVFILLSIKCIFFSSRDKKAEKEQQGILLKNESGKLLISKETIENLTNSVIKQFESVEQINTKIVIDKENNLLIMINIVVGANVIIKELSVNLQNKIKDAIKNILDLDVKEVDIKVKNFIAKTDTNNNVG